MKKTLALACLAIFIPFASAYADQGGFANSGGSLSGGSSVANPPGTLTIAGGTTLTFRSTDGIAAIDAGFSSSSTVESCSGGGRGGRVTCGFTFTGTCSGTLTANGATQAINGSTYQLDGTDGVVVAGTTGYNSAYTPFYFSNTGQILRSDDLNGSNLISYGTQGSDVGQFYGAYGIAVDSAGRIYVADTYSVVRVDDMTGTNWTSISLGSSTTPHSIAVDSSGMVLVGGGGAQIVDNMAGVLTSSSQLTQYYGPYYVFGATPVPLPTPRPSAISFSPPTLTFSQNIGTTSATQAMTITNFGGSPLNGLNLSASGGFSETNNCPAVLPAGSNCTVSVTFTPPSVGSVTGALNVSDDSGNLGSAQVVMLNGTGTTPAAAVTPTTLSFSSQVAGTTSTARNITLQSTGTGPLQGASITVTAPFSQTNNCTGSIAPAASCTIQVTFAPTVVGSASGTVTITDNAGTQTVSLIGSGSAPVSLSSTRLSFGTLAVGDTSPARTVTVTNRQNVALSFSSITVSGPFAVASNTCVADIAAGASCAIGVAFSPDALGSATGVLTLTDSAVTSPQTVSLTGTGSAPVTLSTRSLSFDDVAVGNTSSVETVTLTNRQSVALNFAGTAVSAGFGVASNTCGASLAAGASCTVGVTFSPTTTGSITGALTFTDDAPNSPQTVSLSGTGQ